MAYEKGPIKTGKSPKPGKGDGRMYTGGTPNFDERTGQYREGKPDKGSKPGDIRFKPPFERAPAKPGDLVRRVPPRGAKPLPKPAPGNGKRPVKPKPKPKPRGEGGKTTILSDWARRERQLPSKVKPGTRKKSGDMGSSARNQRFPKPAPSRRGGR
jgi:hypothetical protein